LRFLILDIVSKNNYTLPLILNSASDDAEDVGILLGKIANGETFNDEDNEAMDRLKDEYPEAFEDSDNLGQILLELSEYLVTELMPKDSNDSGNSSDSNNSNDNYNNANSDDNDGSDDSSETIVPGRNYPPKPSSETVKNQEESEDKTKELEESGDDNGGIDF
jgi:hypothetical protein